MRFTLSIGLSLASGFLILEAVANSGFASSCNSYSIFTPSGRITNHFQLDAHCVYESIYNVDTILNLDKCIVNAGGVMHAQQNGGFSGSCKTGHLSGSVITANCGNGARGTVTSSLDLNSFVGNQNGFLCCSNQCGGP